MTTEPLQEILDALVRDYPYEALIILEEIRSLRQRNKQQEKALAIALKALDYNKTLDNIKSELYASVYTVEDDEFTMIYFVRDEMYLAKKEIEKLLEEE